ncbi:unnamed protein product [Ranitomeya imitator]|uniref:Sodium-coupled monocarboxylate transporter 2 n=1 Tax=Ranitomeya imitator TaxID=111125 RepID=A0ABN9LXK0_9NEOB|nr:unnamed protein product [Ranitomeya imitator]
MKPKISGAGNYFQNQNRKKERCTANMIVENDALFRYAYIFKIARTSGSLCGMCLQRDIKGGTSQISDLTVCTALCQITDLTCSAAGFTVPALSRLCEATSLPAGPGSVAILDPGLEQGGSTVAASINALATVTYEDIVKNVFKNISDKKSTWISKGLCVLFGILCTVMAVVASFMGGVVQAALSIHGMCGGPMLGLFSLGILFPWTNWKGALGGLLTGITLSFWVAIGGFIYPAPPSKTLPLTLRTDGCKLLNETINGTLATVLPTSLTTAIPRARSVLADNWYSLSYLYYSAVGCLGCIIAGLLISFITGHEHGKNIKPLFIRPVCNLVCFWSDKYKKKCWCGVRHDEEDEEELDDAVFKKDVMMIPVQEKQIENSYDNDYSSKPTVIYNAEEKSYTNPDLDKECKM